MMRSISPPNVVWVKDYVYVVQDGDTLSSITQKLSGNKSRYYELVGANSQKPQAQAPGFRYNFFAELVPGEKLKIPGNWRSAKVSYGISGPQVPPVEFPSMLAGPYDGLVNQFGLFLPVFQTWYNTNATAYGLPALTADNMTSVASILYGWQPYISQIVPQLGSVDLMTVFVPGFVNQQTIDSLKTLVQKAIDLTLLTTPVNPIPPTVAQTLPWGSIPWEGVPWVLLTTGFNGLNNAAPLFEIFTQIAPAVPATSTPDGGYGYIQSGGIEQSLWNPNDLGIPSNQDVLTQIPWDKIAQIDWNAVAVAIQKYGAGTPENIKATVDCWSKCLADATKLTVEDFFYDVNIDAKHGCCRDKCAGTADCANLACPSGQSFNLSTGKCEPYNPQVIPACEDGYTYDSTTGKCTIPKEQVPPVKCPDGTRYDEFTKKCICGNGGQWNGEQNKCVTTPPLPCKECEQWIESEGKCEPILCGTNPSECEKQGKVVGKCGCGCVDKSVAPEATGKKDNTVFYVVAGLAGLLIVGGTIIAVSGDKKSTSSKSE